MSKPKTYKRRLGNYSSDHLYCAVKLHNVCPLVYYVCANRLMSLETFVTAAVQTADPLVTRGSYLTRWKVSQYMKTGCAAAMAIVRYIRSWFLAPRTNRPSAAASDRIFNRRVRICHPNTEKNRHI